MQPELEHALAELRDPLRRVEVEEADEVDREEREPERERDDRRVRELPVARRDAVDHERREEERGQDVGERQRPADRPVHLLERHARRWSRGRGSASCRASLSTRANSSARVRRSSFVRSSGESGVPASEPACQRACRSRSAASIASTSSGATITPAPASRTNAGGRAVGRHCRDDRALGGEVLEHLRRDHARAAPRHLGHQQEVAPRSRAGARATGGAERTGAARAARRARALRPTRGRPRGSRRRSARPSRSRSARANAVRNGRGSRLPNIAPVCVTRKRPFGRYSIPAKSSKSAPFEITLTSPARRASGAPRR